MHSSYVLLDLSVALNTINHSIFLGWLRELCVGDLCYNGSPFSRAGVPNPGPWTSTGV